MRYRTIGVAGQKQNGKDSLADYLAGKLNRPGSLTGADDWLPWGRASFATEVKRIYCETFGKDLEFIEKWKEVKEPPPGMDMPVRQGLQMIGDGFRKIQSDIWIKLAFRDPSLYEYSVFSDLRYVNEARAIRNHDGCAILIFRPGYLNFDENKSESELRPLVQWCADTGQEGPISQLLKNHSCLDDVVKQSLANFDYFVRNDGTIKDLQQKIDQEIIPFLEKNND